MEDARRPRGGPPGESPAGTMNQASPSMTTAASHAAAARREGAAPRRWLARALSSVNPVAGLPRDVIPVIFLNLLEPWTINTIWPFLPAMVRNELGVDEARIGFASGIIGASFFAGQAASGYAVAAPRDAVAGPLAQRELDPHLAVPLALRAQVCVRPAL